MPGQSDPYAQVPWWIAAAYLTEAARWLALVAVTGMVVMLGWDLLRSAWETVQAQGGR